MSLWRHPKFINNSSWVHQISSNIVTYHQISSYIIKYHQLSIRKSSNHRKSSIPHAGTYGIHMSLRRHPKFINNSSWIHQISSDCKAFYEFLLRTVFDKDYLRLPYNKQKWMEPKFCTVSLLLENLSKKYDPKGFPYLFAKSIGKGMGNALVNNLNSLYSINTWC